MTYTITGLTYRLWSVSNDDDEYFVWVDNGKWKCSGCASYIRNRSCGHIRAVWEFVKEPKDVPTSP